MGTSTSIGVIQECLNFLRIQVDYLPQVLDLELKAREAVLNREAAKEETFCLLHKAWLKKIHHFCSGLQTYFFKDLNFSLKACVSQATSRKIKMQCALIGRFY